MGLSYMGTDRCHRGSLVDAASLFRGRLKNDGQIPKVLSRYSASSFALLQCRFASRLGKYLRWLAVTTSLAVANTFAFSAPMAEAETTSEKMSPPQGPTVRVAKSWTRISPSETTVQTQVTGPQLTTATVLLSRITAMGRQM